MYMCTCTYTYSYIFVNTQMYSHIYTHSHNTITYETTMIKDYINCSQLTQFSPNNHICFYSKFSGVGPTDLFWAKCFALFHDNTLNNKCDHTESLSFFHTGVCSCEKQSVYKEVQVCWRNLMKALQLIASDMMESPTRSIHRF